MAMRLDVNPLPQFDPVGNPTSLSQCWKSWKRRFETYLVALNITDDKQKRALLLYQAGQETQEIFDTLAETGEDYSTALAKLDEYFLPKKNLDYETFQFRQASQKSNETVDQFVTRLRKLAVHCEFPDLDRELKSAVIQNCMSKRLRRYALREDDMTLDKILSKAWALEASKTQAKGMENSVLQSSGNPSESVKYIRKTQYPCRPTQSRPQPNQVSVANVDCHGPTQRIHAQPKVKRATNVASRTTLPRCAKWLKDTTTSGSTQAWILTNTNSTKSQTGR